MAVCDDATINLDWQWNVNTENFESSPFSAVRLYCLELYQVVNARVVANPAFPNPEDAFMQALQFGQRQNPNAQRTYEECMAHSDDMDIHSFVRKIVLCAAPGQASDFAQAKVNTDWQLQNNPASCQQALTFWQLSHNKVIPGLTKIFYASNAGQALMNGQRQTATVLRLYRACFRDDPARLFGLLTGGNVAPGPPRGLTGVVLDQ
jgi:hypothetical protein